MEGNSGKKLILHIELSNFGLWWINLSQDRKHNLYVVITMKSAHISRNYRKVLSTNRTSLTCKEFLWGTGILTSHCIQKQIFKFLLWI